MRSTVPQLLLYLVSCSYTIGIFAYLPPNAWNLASNLHQDHINQPVVKSSKRPLLTVIDPIAKTRIHLVGVAHGSESSAELVRHVISEIPNPAAVVLELCEERFFAISINAKIRPRGNETYSLIFDRTSEKLAAQRTTENAENSDSGLQLYFSNINNTLRFARSKGPIAGTLLLFLLFSSSMRQLMRSNTVDEFVAAMIEAEKFDIPIRLADAPQDDTLNSFKRVLSSEMFDPRKIVQGASLLAFSTLGLLPSKSNRSLSSRIPPSIMKASKWINIPGTFVDNSSLFKSMLPALLVSFIATVPVLLQFFDDESLRYTALSGDLPVELEPISRITTAISLLFMIRLVKVIGTDRDSIIARNIQVVATEFPDQDIVVVIGMLHCNGVARWLLSGVDPLTFSTSVNGEVMID